MSELSESNCPKCGKSIPEGAPHGLCPKCVLADVSNATQEDTQRSQLNEAPSFERLSEAFPELEIKELVGQGGMGFVYRARQSKLERDVALKVLPESLAKDPAFSERFTREGQLLAKLNHNNIVTVFDFGCSGPFYFLLMEYVDGVNLRQAMQAGRFTPEQALSVVPKICEALQFAHDKGVLHRDIKPENILMDLGGQVKIADFGIAKMVGELATNSGLTVSGAKLGTPHYMAPEQIRTSKKIDHRADIYSLGVVFYELLTGELPLGRFEPPSDRASLDSRIDEIVLRALERDRERRQQSATEIKTQIEGLTAPRSAPESTSQETRIPTEAVKKQTLAPALGLGTVAAMSVLVFPLARLGLSFQPTFEFLAAFQALAGVAAGFFTLIIAFGAYKLARVEDRGIALLGATMAIISCPWTLIGLPIGIWGLYVLHQPKIKAAFPVRHRPRSQAPTGNPWPRRIFLLLVLLIVTPIVLIVIAFLATLLSYRSMEAPRGQSQKPTTIASVQQNGHSESKIGSGTLSLVGIKEHGSEHRDWLRPDGGPFLDAEIDSTAITLSPAPGERSYEFLVRKNDLPEDLKIISWSSNPPFSSVATTTAMNRGQHDPALILVGGILGESVRTMGLQATIAQGEFASVAQCKASSIANNQYSHQAGSINGSSWEFTFAIAHQDEESMVVILTYDVANRDIRLIGKNSEGRAYQATTEQQGAQLLSATFEGNAMTEITEFVAQSRPYRTISFPGIPLPKPGNSKE